MQVQGQSWAAGVFHRGEIEIGALKEYLYEQGVEVRR